MMSTSQLSGQPEFELSPQMTFGQEGLPDFTNVSTPTLQPEVEPSATPLTQALRSNVDQLDGMPRLLTWQLNKRPMLGFCCEQTRAQGEETISEVQESQESWSWS